MFKLLALFALASAECINFEILAGNDCSWACNYCATFVGPNYYFTTDVCKYGATGCIGTPEPNVTYTCCSKTDILKAGSVYVVDR